MCDHAWHASCIFHCNLQQCTLTNLDSITLPRMYRYCLSHLLLRMLQCVALAYLGTCCPFSFCDCGHNTCHLIVELRLVSMNPWWPRYSSAEQTWKTVRWLIFEIEFTIKSLFLILLLGQIYKATAVWFAFLRTASDVDDYVKKGALHGQIRASLEVNGYFLASTEGPKVQ